VLGARELPLSTTAYALVLTRFTPEAFHRGTHPFICTQNECGGDPEQHRGMQGGIIIQ
jgi:hypothetical protein